ncbi:hypothetical protein OIU77_022332 [Salix suchowensis]|uniref:Calcium-transporting P-type ATPase N-terminal autoinhibitory domain-containing protein n=1 Tax=Salix suchowensis TaxID=1278906 RepID=A0ABQ9C2Y3_9ROSI|nr:hypothetical protein OIU77_022332 [Salix suchowensis]
MEKYLKENFVLDAKRPSEEALRRWRSAVSVVRNPRRRFRMVADLAKRAEAEKKRQNIQETSPPLGSLYLESYMDLRELPCNIDIPKVNCLLNNDEKYFSSYVDQEKIRIAVYVKKAALHFIEAANRVEHKLSDNVRQTGFGIEPDELAAIVRSQDNKTLESHGGVEGLAREISVSLNDGVVSSVHGILLQSIFQNTGSEVTKGKDGKTNILGTPTETAILEFGLLMGGDFKTHHIESEIVKVEPFNSEKKKMSVLVSLPDSSRVRAFCKGASEIVLKMCDKILTSDGKAVLLSEDQRQKITDVINGFACEALRTLCLAFKDIEKTSDADSIPDSNYTLIAVVGIKDPVRPGVKEAVRTCLAAGITVRMVTGDNINTAKAIAKECGILTDTGLAIEGPDFRNKSSQELEEIIPRLQVMARSSPLDKHKLVTQLRNVAKESADVIVMDDNFKTIVNVARWGRAVYINIQKFVQFQLTVNVVALMINFICACISGQYLYIPT